jgi:hypothetical protein
MKLEVFTMRVDKRGYVYLGKQYSGQEFHVGIEKDGYVLRLERVVTIPAKDAWFYDPDWQKGEMRAQQDIDEGKTYQVEDAAELILRVRKKKKK